MTKPSFWKRPARQCPPNVLQFKQQRRDDRVSHSGRKTARWPWALLIASPLIGLGVAWASSSDGALLDSATSLASADPAAEKFSVTFSRCGSGARYNCVVDGDTFWLFGEKIRIADINTPEVGQPKCAEEAKLGAQATARLLTLLNMASFSLKSVDRDVDRYGRKLRIVTRGGDSLGEVLVKEGLAEEWTGSRREWC